MITALKLDLSDDQRRAIGAILTGKPVLATRKQIVEWSMKSLAAKIDTPNGNGKTCLKNMICPRCNKPIAVPVPVVEVKP